MSPLVSELSPFTFFLIIHFVSFINFPPFISFRSIVKFIFFSYLTEAIKVNLRMVRWLSAILQLSEVRLFVCGWLCNMTSADKSLILIVLHNPQYVTWPVTSGVNILKHGTCTLHTSERGNKICFIWEYKVIVHPYDINCWINNLFNPKSEMSLNCLPNVALQRDWAITFQPQHVWTWFAGGFYLDSKFWLIYGSRYFVYGPFSKGTLENVYFSKSMICQQTSNDVCRCHIT